MYAFATNHVTSPLQVRRDEESLLHVPRPGQLLRHDGGHRPAADGRDRQELQERRHGRLPQDEPRHQGGRRKYPQKPQHTAAV